MINCKPVSTSSLSTSEQKICQYLVQIFPEAPQIPFKISGVVLPVGGHHIRSIKPNKQHDLSAVGIPIPCIKLLELALYAVQL